MKKIIVAVPLALALMVPMFVSADHAEVTSIVDVMMPSSVCTITNNIGLGSRGADVTCLQRALVEAKLLSPALATGYFGPYSREALTKWQEQKGLPPTGFFGGLSRAAFSAKEGVIASGSSTLSGGNGAATTGEPMHTTIDVGAWPLKPSVSIVLHPDTMSGYNVEIVPTNFRFAPEHVNGTVVPNEGHAHLMVNGKKIARVYGEWFHIGKENFVVGNNEVHVTLNANDHSELAIGSARVEAKEMITIK